jgi:tetratricopeptide (TPR) repeat protein/transcriptional regulator with XRE-family HTH domain
MDDASRFLTFGTLLKRYRRAANLTQAELAERSGYSAVFISMLERGVRAPLAATRELLAGALQLPPHECATLEAASCAVPPAPPAPAPPLPLVGRLLELRLLEQHLAGEGPPMLLLEGEPGIGKTRLLQEATSSGTAQGMSVLVSGCHRRSGQEPYAPLLDALQQFIARQPPPDKRLALQGCAWLVRLLPELAAEASLAAPSWTLPPEQERRLMFAAVGRFLANVTGPTGTLLVLDDLQWAGPDALDLLASLVRSAASLRVRVVGAYRSTEIQPGDPLSMTLADLAGARLMEQWVVGPLGQAEARQLLQGVLEGGEDPGVAQVEQLLARTGGVPFFLVSCAQALRVEVGSAPRVPKASEVVPRTVAESIRQRVALLPQTAQEVLGAAAVAGREVHRKMLLGLAAQAAWSQRETLTAVESACRAGLLVEQRNDAYAFTHDLIREVVSADLSAVRRAVLHQQVAAVLEQQSGEPPLEALAYHYEQSEQQEKALYYLQRAGDRAKHLYAHAEAEGYYQALVERHEQLGQRAEAARAREQLGAVLITMGRYDQALEALERAIDQARAAGDRESEWQAMGRLAEAYDRKGIAPEGLTRLQPWLPPGEGQERSPGLAMLYQQLSTLYVNSGRPQEALAAAERSVELARALDDQHLQVYAEWWRIQALDHLGRFEESLHAWEQLLPQAEELGDFLAISVTLWLLGWRTEGFGRFEASAHYYERGLAYAEQLGDPSLVVRLLTDRGGLALIRGAWEQARADFERAAALVEQQEQSYVWAAAPQRLGKLCLYQGQWQAASQYLEEARVRARKMHQHIELLGVYCTLGERELLAGHPEGVWAQLEPLLEQFNQDVWPARFPPFLAWVLLERGDLAQAETLLEQTIAHARAQSQRVVLVSALHTQALVYLRQQQWKAAQHALEEALLLARTLPLPYEEVKALYRLGQLYLQQEHPEQAREQFEAALVICARLGERLYAEYIEQALAKISLG